MQSIYAINGLIRFDFVYVWTGISVQSTLIILRQRSILGRCGDFVFSLHRGTQRLIVLYTAYGKSIRYLVDYNTQHIVWTVKHIYENMSHVIQRLLKQTSHNKIGLSLNVEIIVMQKTDCFLCINYLLAESFVLFKHSL